MPAHLPKQPARLANPIGRDTAPFHVPATAEKACPGPVHLPSIIYPCRRSGPCLTIVRTTRPGLYMEHACQGQAGASAHAAVRPPTRNSSATGHRCRQGSTDSGAMTRKASGSFRERAVEKRKRMGSDPHWRMNPRRKWPQPRPIAWSPKTLF